MASQENTRICFVTWNVCGIKHPQGKFSRMLNILRSFCVDIAFIQETHEGIDGILENTMEDEMGIKWKVFFTVHRPRSKGVAILIQENVEFEYIEHDEDCSGGYIVLFCRLYGKMYTLVNVYNHKWDRTILPSLKEYLMQMPESVLVVGGDFNTVLDPTIDRKPPCARNDPLFHILEDFTTSLNIMDTWSKHIDTDIMERYTWEQKTDSEEHSCSRLDMFFVSKDKIKWVHEIEVKKNDTKLKDISDHYPLLLTLEFQVQAKRKCINNDAELKRSDCSSERRPGKISGQEILSAMKSLSDVKKHRTDTVNVRSDRCLLTETLKIEYNDILSSQRVPESFKFSKDTDYLIFAEILAKRLKMFISAEEKCDIGVIVIFDRSPQKIRWSFLEKIFQKLDKFYKEKDSKYAGFAPEPKFGILDDLLPKTKNFSTDLRDLRSGCPLTNAILNLALDDLDLKAKEKCKTTVCYHKHSLIIHTDGSTQGEIFKLVEEFQEDSGVLLSYR